MITIENLSKNYDNFIALENINLKIFPKEIFGIVGQSGAGKSTLLRTINRLENVSCGKITVDNEDVLSLEGKKLLNYRRNVGMIFQHFTLMETRTVFKNIALPLECQRMNKELIREKVLEVAKLVGIEDKLDFKPRSLSGGQRQRVAIARALCTNPKILLCDEATSALDPITTKSILELLKELNKKLDLTIVIVTHQMEVIKNVCERICILENGIIKEIGKTEELFLNSKSAFNHLISEEEIIPNYGRNIKLFFPKNSSKDSIITKMARQLNVDFSICYGKLEKFQEDVLGTLIINVDINDEKKICEYLSLEKVVYQVIEND